MDDPLTVALVSTEREWQGGEEQAWQLALGLRSRGHRCVPVALDNRPFAQRLASAQFELLPLTGKFPAPPRVWNLRRRLMQLNPDVVYLNDAHAVTLGGMAAWRLRRAVTIAARRASFAIRSPGRYCRLCHRVFCVSQFAADRCASAGIPVAQLRVVHDGVDPERVASGDRRRGRAGLGVRPDDLLLLSVGSLVKCKGHRFLIDAMAAVIGQHPNARLVIAGAGDQRHALEDQIAHRGLQRAVRLLGFRSDIPDLIRACDLFVFPSVEEGLGSTLIDVMLAAKPIVATTAGGIPDVVGTPRDGRSEFAWLVTPGQFAELSQAIVTALGETQLTASMARRGQQRARDRFTVDHMVENTIREFREALAHR